MVTVMIKDETLLRNHYICLFLANLGLSFNLCEQYNVFLGFFTLRSFSNMILLEVLEFLYCPLSSLLSVCLLWGQGNREQNEL